MGLLSTAAGVLNRPSISVFPEEIRVKIQGEWSMNFGIDKPVWIQILDYHLLIANTSLHFCFLICKWAYTTWWGCFENSMKGYKQQPKILCNRSSLNSTLPTSYSDGLFPQFSHSWCSVVGLLPIQTCGRKETIISYFDTFLKYTIFNSKIKCFILYLKCFKHFMLLKYF